jgi:hypothetical protein
VYQKKCFPDLWLEFNADKSRWQLKGSKSKGTANCTAELRVPTAHGAGASGAKRGIDAKVCFEIQEWFVFDGTSEFVEQGCVKMLPLATNVHVRGTEGVCAMKTIGVYMATEDVCCGLPVYQKLGDFDMWLEYNAQRKRYAICHYVICQNFMLLCHVMYVYLICHVCVCHMSHMSYVIRGDAASRDDALLPMLQRSLLSAIC